jgi:hypothetical protein
MFVDIGGEGYVYCPAMPNEEQTRRDAFDPSHRVYSMLSHKHADSCA